MIRVAILAICLAHLVAGEAAQFDAAALAQRSPLIAALAPPAGAWSEDPAKAAERSAEVQRISAAGKRFITALKAAKDGPSEPSQRAVAALVEQLASDAKATTPDVMDPVFARRAVRGGALRGLGADAAAGELEKAVAEAMRFVSRSAFSGPQGARLEERCDAFGVGGWALAGTRTAYAVAHSRAQFVDMPALILVVELPTKGDPAGDAAKALSATVCRDGQVLATWTAKDGRLAADLVTWRAAVPAPSGQGVLPGMLPPHLVLTGLDGDPVRLATLSGSVVPARSAKPAESERFIAEVAKALPATADLDLVGQHLFRYVFDSPDTRFPTVIGSREIKGEIHQTAAQTLATTAGGQCRGDCDDLAELYQTIAEKQGRLGHLLILPSHTAFASAHKDGGDWVVEVMQTGPTMAFRGPTLPEALRATHANFDPAAPFSPDHLGLLLRFSGENTRGPFGLGWRIFADAAYARTMIDVQRDWQYQTYARAIAKMDKLIAGGDRDPANLHELAGLYQVTGQWAAAAKEFRAEIEVLTDDVSLFEVRMEYAATLRRDGKNEEAGKVLAEIAATLPALAPKLGIGTAKLGMRLSLAQLAANDRAGGRKTLMQTAFGPLAQMTGKAIQMVSQPGFDQARWSGDGNLASVRGLIQGYIGCLLVHLKKAGPDAAKDPTLVNARMVVDVWLAKLAFLEADSPADAVSLYATAARIHALDLPAAELAKAVAAAKAPAAAAAFDHRARKAGPAAQSLEADLPWIHISPAWWLGEVNRALRGEAGDESEEEAIAKLDPARIDRARVAAAAQGATAAFAACTALGLVDRGLEQSTHFAQLTAAVIAGDDKALRERLRFVKRENDKRLRDATAGTIGSLAPACDEKRWQAVLKAWADEVDYKPKWYSIAWTAVVAGAPKQGLATARMAAARFKDDATFTEELAFMEKLLAGK